MNTIKTTFLIRESKTNKKGTTPIYFRIIGDNDRAEISTKKYIAPSKWDSVKRRGIGNKPSINSLNRYLDQFEHKALEAETQILKEGEKVTASAIKDKLLSRSKPKNDLIQYFKSHLDKMNELIGNGYAENTYKRYRTCFKHLKNYVKKQYGKDVYYLSELDLTFIQEFEHYLKTKKKPCNHNSALKYIDHLKKVVNSAIDRELIKNNPFLKYKAKYEDTDPEYLTHAELKTIAKKKLPIERLDRVRNVFLFCCYTGLAYVDVEKLQETDLETDSDGDLWLVVKRQKTKEPAYILLLDIPVKILKKYRNDPETDGGKLLPVISNQNTNAYLKEIATLCGMSKNLTFHMARHTFAGTYPISVSGSLTCVG